MKDNIKKIDECIDQIRYVLDNTCHLCTEDIPDGSIKHKIDDSTICDSCWKKLKAAMDQEG